MGRLDLISKDMQDFDRQMQDFDRETNTSNKGKYLQVVGLVAICAVCFAIGYSMNQNVATQTSIDRSVDLGAAAAPLTPVCQVLRADAGWETFQQEWCKMGYDDKWWFKKLLLKKVNTSQRLLDINIPSSQKDQMIKQMQDCAI